MRTWPWALILVLAVGAIVRIAAMYAYAPAVLTLSDTASYVSQAGGQLFGDPNHPAGYGLILRIIHTIFHDVTWTLVIQHLVLLGVAVVLYRVTRGLGVGRGLATIPAAVIALNGDLIFLEHALMADAPFTAAIALAAACALMALREPRVVRFGVTTRDLWLLGAGFLIGVGAVVRFVGAPLIALLAIWAAIVFVGSWKHRARVAAFAVAGGAAVLLAYAVLNGALSGTWGLTGPGWSWYVRTAQFADCRKFDPPAGTSRLCEKTPSNQRMGPDFYGYDPQSPAVKLFGPSPAGADKVQAFGKQVVIHQPLDYLKTVGNDFLRYFAPSYDNRRGFNGPGYELTDFSRRAPGVEESINRTINLYYDDEKPHVRGGITSLYDYQQIFRVEGVLLLLALIVGALGFRNATRNERAAIALGWLGGVALLLIPVATVIYSERYAIPASPLLAIAAAVGATALARGRRRGEGAPAAAEPESAPAERAPAPGPAPTHG